LTGIIRIEAFRETGKMKAYTLEEAKKKLGLE
jgi:hypothetical protein